MAVESIGTIYPTKIPGLADAADIQAALRAYHYGSYTYDTTNSSTASLEANSMAKFLFDIETDITALENRPSSGGEVNTAAPVAAGFTPTEIPDGFIWVDEDGTLGGATTGATAIFTNTAPTTSLTTGTIWVDKDATTITANPFIPQALISAKGDLIVGSANDTATILTTGTNGQVLKANSATTSGLEWGTDNSYSEPTLGSTSITSGATVTTIAGLTLTSPTISTITNTGSLTLPTSTDTLVGRATTDTLTNKTLTSPVISSITNTGTITLPTSTDTLVGKATTDTLTNKTLTSPKEFWTVSATAIAAASQFDVVTQGVLYYTTASTSNWTVNFRGSSGTTLNSLMSVGDAVTVNILVSNTTAYYQSTAVTVDTNATLTIKWSGGTAAASGNASAVDIYSYTIVKTATSTFTVLCAGPVKYA